jgi:hypothetical protein
MTQVTSNNPQFRILRSDRGFYILQKRRGFFWSTFTMHGKFGGIGGDHPFLTPEACEQKAKQWLEQQKENKVVKYFDV